MDRIKRDDRPAPAAAESAGAKILKFPPRAPRLVPSQFGSGWYHQTAIDAADHGPDVKR